jgi:hypothetical protein
VPKIEDPLLGIDKVFPVEIKWKMFLHRYPDDPPKRTYREHVLHPFMLTMENVMVVSWNMQMLQLVACGHAVMSFAIGHFSFCPVLVWTSLPSNSFPPTS